MCGGELALVRLEKAVTFMGDQQRSYIAKHNSSIQCNLANLPRKHCRKCPAYYRMYFETIRQSKVANPYGLSVRITEFDLFHSLTAVGPKSYGYKIILRV